MSIWPVLFIILSLVYRGALGIFLGFGIMRLSRQEEKERAAGQRTGPRQKPQK